MKVVLTGGPSAGKTVIAENILREFRDQVVIVPESASILFRGGFPRGTQAPHVIHQQKAIYRVQVELEAILKEENPGKLIVCDRGTLDGLAYWPVDQNTFFKELNTTLQNELNRYDCVIHLETASGSSFDHNNPLRLESESTAHQLDKKIKNIWHEHPKRIIIHNTCLFSEKALRVLEITKGLLNAPSKTHK